MAHYHWIYDRQNYMQADQNILSCFSGFLIPLIRQLKLHFNQLNYQGCKLTMAPWNGGTTESYHLPTGQATLHVFVTIYDGR